MAVIYIPRDPRTKSIKFLTGQPESLKDIISVSEWITTIEEINEVIEKSNKLEIFSLVCNILVIPLFFVKKYKMEENLHKYLKYKNGILIESNVFICHPKASQYNELRVIISRSNG